MKSFQIALGLAVAALAACSDPEEEERAAREEWENMIAPPAEILIRRRPEPPPMNEAQRQEFNESLDRLLKESFEKSKKKAE